MNSPDSQPLSSEPVAPKRRSHKFLAALVLLALVVAGFYAVENWRGRRAWEKYRQELIAQGEVLDWRAYIPPAVPDDQNFLKVPLMSAWLDPQSKYTNLQHVRSELGLPATPAESVRPGQQTNLAVADLVLWPAGAPDTPKEAWPVSDLVGDKANVEASLCRAARAPLMFDPRGGPTIIGSRVASQRARIHVALDTQTTPEQLQALLKAGQLTVEPTDEAGVLRVTHAGVLAEDVLESFRPWEAEYDVLYQACQRPHARLEGNFETLVPPPHMNFVRLRTIAQDLCVRANANLVAGRPDAAWRDLRVLARLMDYSQECDLSLVAAMIRTAMGDLYGATVNQGLAAGLWREEQLAAIQQQNQTMDLLGGYVQAMRGGERAWMLRVLDRCREVGAAQNYRELMGKDASPWRDSLGRFLLLAPRGWICQNEIAIARAMQAGLAPLDAKHQRIDFQKRSPADEAAALKSVSGSSPYSFLAAYVTPNLSKALSTTAKNQTMLNMAAVGCALQRHRLALGQYPESLEALSPQFMAKLPHELTTGQPFKYRRFDDGRFLLYSVGMNGKDDTAASKANGAGKGVVVAEDDWGWTSTPTR